MRTSYSEHQVAGQSTRDLAARRHNARVWFILSMIGAVLLLLLVASFSKKLGLGGAGVLVIILIARVTMDFTEAKERRLFKLERRAARGAKGEEDVARILDNLNPDEYLVLHDIVSPYG